MTVRAIWNVIATLFAVALAATSINIAVGVIWPFVSRLAAIGLGG